MTCCGIMVRMHVKLHVNKHDSPPPPTLITTIRISSMNKCTNIYILGSWYLYGPNYNSIQLLLLDRVYFNLEAIRKKGRKKDENNLSPWRFELMQYKSYFTRGTTQ